MIPCSQCGMDLSEEGKNSAIASISGGIMGDEYIESYYFCKQCQVYTVEVCHDQFLGDEDVAFRGPLTKKDGDKQINLIKQCATPWDKKCRCQAHLDYFGVWLD